jgi:hydroxyacylglutathione hydrolase
MIVKRFYDEKLAQASYLIGCAATGEALVVDANRDVEQYLRAAEAEGVRITHVSETHIHADYVSGSRELAYRAGAQLYLSDEGDENWKYAFAADAGAILVRDGDRFDVGNIRIDVLHTPGHTPEHISFLVTDGAAADRPIGAVTGDFVFVGDVGRPDLLERAANFAGTMEAGARVLFRSLQKFKAQPDYLQIWPGHGAGSACGKGLSSIPTSTVGYERLFNWAFQIADEDEFVTAVLAGQPEPPKYFAEMKRINKEGPAILGGFRRPERLASNRMVEVLAQGGLVVDTRLPAAFASGHVPNTLNIPQDKSFTTWAGWLVPYSGDFYLLVEDKCSHCIDEAVRDLAMIGLDRVAGYFGAEAVDAWHAAGRPLGSVPQIGVEELEDRARRGEVAILDVRGAAEWEAGRLLDGLGGVAGGPSHIPLGYLTERLNEVPTGRPLVVYCQGGGRSAIAASVLRARGYPDVTNLTGGYAAWQAAGKEVARGAAEAVGAAS